VNNDLPSSDHFGRGAFVASLVWLCGFVFFAVIMGFKLDNAKLETARAEAKASNYALESTVTRTDVRHEDYSAAGWEIKAVYDGLIYWQRYK
jgi:hypothetical protein